MEPVPSTLTKTYPPRGPLQQFRFAEASAFTCFRCRGAKKSKLISIYLGDWARKVCNGCYGLLLSIFEIKAGTSSQDQRAEQLAEALLSAVTLDSQRHAAELLRTAENRAALLCPEAVRFVATAEHVAKQLDAEPQLEWSPAIIGLCKAVEAEVVVRILRPLAARASARDISGDRNDKDLGRVAAFCVDASRKPPEIGAFAHFLQTLIHSKERRGTSTLLGTFLELAKDWPASHWILEPAGLHEALSVLTNQFRNRAAHIDEMSRADYFGCREHVIGVRGVLWQIVLSTERHDSGR